MLAACGFQDYACCGVGFRRRAGSHLNFEPCENRAGLKGCPSL